MQICARCRNLPRARHVGIAYNFRLINPRFPRESLMKRIAFCSALALFMAGGLTLKMHGQGGGNPFIDHSDTGETIHVLPAPASIHSPHATQPTDAPAHRGAAVFPASYGSGSLVNHGGHQIPFAVFYPI